MQINIYVKKEYINKFYKDSTQEYYKRFSSICKINLTFYKKYDEIPKKIKNNHFNFIVNKNYLSISSTDLAEKINKITVNGISTINFIICDKTLENLDIFDNIEYFSISNMDMSVGLTLTILYEQIYRCFTIINGRTYHK